MLLGIWREDMSSGASISDGLGDWPVTSSALLLALTVLEGAWREAEE